MAEAVPNSPTNALAAFDVARAGAALAVLLAHGRSFVLLDLKDQPALSPIGQVFYGLSAPGHQAVVVFFVVSGALVTRSMVGLEAGGCWSWRNFVTTRLTRHWTVLLPCLLLGGCLDRIGMLLGDHLVYAGHYGALRVADPPVAIRLDLLSFAGNLVFLQTIAVPPFGTNVPLWSLAYEAWYYVAAFLVWSAWRERGRLIRASAFLGGLLAVVGWVFTPDMRALAPTWVLGAALTIWTMGRQTSDEPRGRGQAPRLLLRPAALAVLFATIATARATAAHHQFVGDYVVAVATVLCLFVYRDWQPSPSAMMRAARRIAAFSYSLYLSHFPLLALVASVVLRNRREPFGIGAVLVLAVVLALALIYAAGLWWCFERHTPTVRRWVSRWGKEPRGTATAVALASQENVR